MATNNQLYGLRALWEALAAGRPLEKVWMDRNAASELRLELKQQLQAAGVPLALVPAITLERMARGKAHQGVVATVAQVVYQPLEEVVQLAYDQGQVPRVVVLDGVTDVRNVGAISRTAEALGAHALVLPRRGSAALNADAIKTSAGALMHLPVCRTETTYDACLLLADMGLTLAAGTEKGRHTLHDVDRSLPLALIMGDENLGVSSEVLKLTHYQLHIPLRGQVASLNVSVATGILLHGIMN